MARPPREQVAGGLYHVTMRGNRRGPVFHDQRDRRRFLALVADVVRKHAWRCHAYCLMTNHAHLLLETPEPNISRGMCSLNGRYARWYNDRRALTGHLFERRFSSVLVVDEAHLFRVVPYILLNPVRAGLCNTAGEWPWSSYRATAFPDARVPRFLTVDWLLTQFSDDPLRARELFAQLVEREAAALRNARLAALRQADLATGLLAHA